MPDSNRYGTSFKYCYIYLDPFGDPRVGVSGDPIRTITGGEGILSKLLYVEGFSTWSEALARSDEWSALPPGELAREADRLTDTASRLLIEMLEIHSRASHIEWMNSLNREWDDDTGDGGWEPDGGCLSPIPGGPSWTPPSRPYGEQHCLPTV